MTRQDLGGGRGLGKYLDMMDSKGNRFRLQDSSAAMEPCFWIFTDQVIGKHTNGEDDHAALHLNLEIARELINAIYSWADYHGLAIEVYEP